MAERSRAGWRAAFAIGAAVLVAACARPETAVPLGPLLTQGAFLPLEGVAVLRGGAGGRDLPAFWMPHPALPVDGWGRPVGGWRPLGARATLDLSLWEPGATELVFELRRRRSSAPLRASVLVNGQPLGTTEVEPGRTRGRHLAPPGVLRAVNRVELRFEPPLGQPEIGAAELSLTRIGFRSGSGRGARGERGRLASVDPESSGITLLARGAYLLPLALPAAARPWMYGGLALLLRRQLEAASGRALESAPVELGEDERAILESLGYVD